MGGWAPTAISDIDIHRRRLSKQLRKYKKAHTFHVVNVGNRDGKSLFLKIIGDK
jgi:hypothetical protein